MTQLAVGQGAWAISQSGGTITLTVTGTPLTIPSDTPAAALPVITKGETLFIDDYSSPAAGHLSVTATACCRRSYESGEYVLRVVDPAATTVADGNIPDTYTDTVLEVDVRLVGKTTHRYVRVDCRVGAAGGYRFLIDPEGKWIARRLDGETLVDLASGRSAAINTGLYSNHITLACAGSVIQASVNGTTMVSLTDRTYTSGISRLAVGVYSNSEGERTAEARFVNLVLYRGLLPSTAAGAGAAPQPTGSVDATGSQVVTSPRGYRFEVPSDWQRTDASPYDLKFVSPDHKESVYTIVTNADPPITAKSACVSFQGQLKAARGNGLGSPVDINLPVNVIGANSSALCLYVYRDSSNTIYADYIVTAIRGQTLYTFVLDFPEDQIILNRQQHRHILDSIQFVGAQAAQLGVAALVPNQSDSRGDRAP